MTSTIPMTLRSYRRLQEEQSYLQNQARTEVAAEIGAAAALGDRSENAEYKAAKEKQAAIEARLHEVNFRLAHAEVIDNQHLIGTTKICFSAHVTLLDLDNDSQCLYQIVGEDEANLQENKISIKAPLARALLGKNQGDAFVFQSPGGMSREYEIVSVDYQSE